MVDKYKILCIGDSHTAGYPGFDPIGGGDPESSYQFWLERELKKLYPKKDFNLINEGICGDTSQGIVSRLLHKIENERFELIILAGGTNDLGVLKEEHIISNLTQGIEACRNKNIPLVVASIPPLCFEEYIPRIVAINNKLKAYTKKFDNVYFADWFSALKDKKGVLSFQYNSGDGVHLSIEGYKCIGLLLVPIVSKALSL